MSASAVDFIHASCVPLRWEESAAGDGVDLVLALPLDTPAYRDAMIAQSIDAPTAWASPEGYWSVEVLPIPSRILSSSDGAIDASRQDAFNNIGVLYFDYATVDSDSEAGAFLRELKAFGDARTQEWTAEQRPECLDTLP